MWENYFYSSLFFASALRIVYVLYGSGTDAGWVRLCDAAAPAAISSAANLNVHAGKGRNYTKGFPHDNQHLDLINTRASLSTRTTQCFSTAYCWRHPLIYLHLLLMLCFPPKLSVGAWHYQGNQATLPGPSVVSGLCFCGQNRGFVSSSLDRSFQTSRSHGTNAGLVLNSDQQRENSDQSGLSPRSRSKWAIFTLNMFRLKVIVERFVFPSAILLWNGRIGSMKAITRTSWQGYTCIMPWFFVSLSGKSTVKLRHAL